MKCPYGIQYNKILTSGEKSLVNLHTLASVLMPLCWSLTFIMTPHRLQTAPIFSRIQACFCFLSSSRKVSVLLEKNHSFLHHYEASRSKVGITAHLSPGLVESHVSSYGFMSQKFAWRFSLNFRQPKLLGNGKWRHLHRFYFCLTQQSDQFQYHSMILE